MAKKISLPIQNKQVEDLLLWRDVKLSGAVFGGITLTYFLLSIFKLNTLVLLANSLQVVVVASFLWNTIASVTHRPGVPLPSFLKEGVSEGQVKDLSAKATVLVNKFLAFSYRVLSGKDIVLSLKVAGALFGIARVARYFTLLGLVFTAAVLAFSLPRLYEENQDNIDKVVHKVVSEAKAAFEKYVKPQLEKIPKYKKPEEKTQ